MIQVFGTLKGEVTLRNILPQSKLSGSLTDLGYIPPLPTEGTPRIVRYTFGFLADFLSTGSDTNWLGILLYTRYYFLNFQYGIFFALTTNLSQTKYHTNFRFPTSSETWHTSCTAIVTNMTLHLCYTIKISPKLSASLWHSLPNPCNTIKNIHLIFLSPLGRNFDTSFRNP